MADTASKPLLAGNLNAFALDLLHAQKVQGSTLNWFIRRTTARDPTRRIRPRLRRA